MTPKEKYQCFIATILILGGVIALCLGTWLGIFPMLFGLMVLDADTN
jgi:hypothetical protein